LWTDLTKENPGGEIVSVDIMVNYHGYLIDQTLIASARPPGTSGCVWICEEIHGRFKKLAARDRHRGAFSKGLAMGQRNWWADFFMDRRYTGFFIGHGWGWKLTIPIHRAGTQCGLQEG
jgi:hypothetical protein